MAFPPSLQAFCSTFAIKHHSTPLIDYTPFTSLHFLFALCYILHLYPQVWVGKIWAIYIWGNIFSIDSQTCQECFCSKITVFIVSFSHHIEWEKFVHLCCMPFNNNFLEMLSVQVVYSHLVIVEFRHNILYFWKHCRLELWEEYQKTVRPFYSCKMEPQADSREKELCRLDTILGVVATLLILKRCHIDSRLGNLFFSHSFDMLFDQCGSLCITYIRVYME